MTTDSALIARVTPLYRANRFLDAHELVRSAWVGPKWMKTASAEALMWAGRLAGRLGGSSLRRVLLHEAASRFGDHPAVLVESRWVFRRRRSILNTLEESLERPTLDSGDAELDAQWLIDGAFFWAIVRDFPRAHAMLEQAVTDDRVVDSWYHTTRAQVLLFEDRWDEALEAARRGWQDSPNRPAAAGVLAQILLRMNRLDEALDALASARDGQSFETLMLLAWLTCAKAERSPRDVRIRLAGEAEQLCERLESLAPLRGRAAKQMFAACRFDAAMLAEAPDRMQTQADKLTLPVYRKINQNLRRYASSASPRVLLEYRAVFQKQDRCLPTSIASIAGTFGHALDADKLAEELTYNGTSIWRSLAWLREHGYAAKTFLLTRELAASLLTAGLPFVYAFNTSLDNGHAAAAVGIDEAAGVLLYHDPSGERFGRVLLENLDESEHPIGPWGLAFAPPEQADLLDVIDDRAARLGELCHEFWHAVSREDTPAAAEVVARLEAHQGDSPVTEAFRACWQTQTNQLAEGLATLERLCGQFPKSIALQRMLLGGLGRTRNTARIRDFLGQLVNLGRIPGPSDVTPWSYPPSSCVTRFADLEGLTAEGAPAARELLLRLVERDATFAMAYHTLGDIAMRQGQPDRAALPYRIASLLAHTDEHLARAAFDSERLLGRQADGLAYLRQRVDRLGGLIDGGWPWCTLIGAAEDCGDVAAATETAERALAARGDDPNLLSYLTRFWIRTGERDRAQTLLDRLEKHPDRLRYLEAAVVFHRYIGQWERALALCEEWVANAPDQVEPHRMLASLLRNRQTVFEVAQSARDWADRRADDEEFEFIYYDLLRDTAQEDRREAFVRARLKRNAQDAWAWRELGHLLIGRAEGVSTDRRQALEPEIQEAVEQARRLSPREAATLYLQSRLAEMRGQWEHSIELLLRGLRIEPESSYAYGKAWENSSNLPRAQQEAVLQKLEEQLLRSVGPLHAARGLALGVASRFGCDDARARVEQWQAQRPGDPELIEAHADVLLEHGQGRTDAAVAVTELEEAITRYPRHVELRLSLAYALDRTLDDGPKYTLLDQTVKSWPLDTRARVALASHLVIHETPDDAIELLNEGLAFNPQDGMCWYHLARIQQESGNPSATTETLSRALALLPEDVTLRRQLAKSLSDTGDAPRALQVVRDGLALYPESPVFWHMLADVLTSSPAIFDAQETESALRKALECNDTYYDAADLLAWLLAGQYRFDDARNVLRAIVPKLPNAATAHGRLAWVTWTSGQQQQAIDEMAAALETYPDYFWGWWTLMLWLEELDESEQTCRRLEQLPPAVCVNPDITARRLDLLAKAGLDKEKLDTIWAKALADFPRNEDLLILRFDTLADRDEWDQAEEILRQLEELAGRSAQGIVRRIRLEGHRKNTAKAVETAMEVFRNPQPGTPFDVIWNTLHSADLLAPTVETVLRTVAAGQPLHVGALCTLAGNSNRVTKVNFNGQKLNRKAVLRWLADRMMTRDWDVNHQALAALLEELADCNPSYVRQFLKANRDLCRTHTTLWSAIAYYLNKKLISDPLMKWISDWRQRQGVSMTVVSYYRHGLGPFDGGLAGLLSWKPKLWKTIHEHSRDALDRLGEDKTFRFHVTAMCEALLALDRTKEFVQVVTRYRALLEMDDERYWMPVYYTMPQMAPRLCLLADLMQCDDEAESAALFAQIRRTPRSAIAHAAAVRHVKRRSGFWKRLILTASRVWSVTIGTIPGPPYYR